MITQRYNLNLIPDKVPVIVNCSQYDALSRTIEMVIYDGSTVYEIPSGTSASVRGTKQDNTGFEYPCTIDGSKVSFSIKDQMTIFAGKVPCEIRLSKDGGIIGTCNFLLNVEETPLDPDVTISETDLPLLERAEQNAARAEAAADEAEAILSSAVKSVNNVLPDTNGNVDVDAVYSVNNVTPDSSGNVDVVALPTGGTADQVLVKQSSTDGDADWETAGMWHGDEVGSLPVPINADQLEGHPASYFQPTLSAGSGITIQDNTVSSTNSFVTGTGTVNTTYCTGTVLYRAISVLGKMIVFLDYDFTFNDTYNGHTSKPDCIVCTGLPAPSLFLQFNAIVGTSSINKPILCVYEDGTLRPRFAGNVSGKWYGTWTYIQ